MELLIQSDQMTEHVKHKRLLTIPTQTASSKSQLPSETMPQTYCHDHSASFLMASLTNHRLPLPNLLTS